MWGIKSTEARRESEKWVLATLLASEMSGNIKFLAPTMMLHNTSKCEGERNQWKGWVFVFVFRMRALVRFTLSKWIISFLATATVQLVKSYLSSYTSNIS